MTRPTCNDCTVGYASVQTDLDTAVCARCALVHLERDCRERGLDDVARRIVTYLRDTAGQAVAS